MYDTINGPAIFRIVKNFRIIVTCQLSFYFILFYQGRIYVPDFIYLFFNKAFSEINKFHRVRESNLLIEKGFFRLTMKESPSLA